MGSQTTDLHLAVPVLRSHLPAEADDAGAAPVFWIHLDEKCRWSLHKEGGAVEASCGSRAEAARFLRDLTGTSPYRLFIGMPDGKIVQELHVTMPLPRSENGNHIAVAAPTTVAESAIAAAPNSESAGLGSRLE